MDLTADTWLPNLFWSSGIMDCMLFTFENRVPLMRQGASVVWHLSLPLMNNFNKIETAIFPCRMCFLQAFHFSSLILLTTLMFSACVAAVKCRPVLHHCVVMFFWSSGIMYCMLLTFENRIPLMRQGASFITADEQLQ